MKKDVFRMELRKVHQETAFLDTVVYATDPRPLNTYKNILTEGDGEEGLDFSEIQRVQFASSLLDEIALRGGLLVASERHDGDLGTIGAPQKFNIEEPFWYKNNVQEKFPVTETIQLSPNTELLIMSKDTNPNNAANNEAAQIAAKAAAQALLDAQAPAEVEVTTFQKVKKAATSPTAKTIGMILLAVGGGALGGLAAVEARNRGMFSKTTPQA